MSSRSDERAVTHARDRAPVRLEQVGAVDPDARTFVVGDVHGCLTELLRLLSKAGVTSDDRLVFVGDLVAKGPDSAGVVQLARERGALAVLGNHDDYLLAVREGAPAKDTHRGAAVALAPADWTYLEERPHVLELVDRSSVVLHGGLVPGVPLAQQERGYVLNMRSFDAEGRPSKRVSDGEPWGVRWPGPALAVFGHDARRGLQRHRFALGLDTGCVYGGALTGLWLEARELVQVAARRMWKKPGED